MRARREGLHACAHDPADARGVPRRGSRAPGRDGVTLAPAGRALGAATADASRMSERTPAGKRLLDISLSALGLVISMPVWALVAAAIKIDDGGPVFYSQERVGRGGRVFRAWKFRSMRPDAEA